MVTDCPSKEAAVHVEDRCAGSGGVRPADGVARPRRGRTDFPDGKRAVALQVLLVRRRVAGVDLVPAEAAHAERGREVEFADLPVEFHELPVAWEPRAEDLFIYDALALCGESVFPCRYCKA